MKNSSSIFKYILIYIFIYKYANAQDSTKYVANKIVWYGEQNLGKKVDRGECWDLAAGALNYAEADWKSPYGFGEKIDYKKSELKPGDVIQMSNVKFVYPNGSMSFPMHTALVYKANKNMVTVLHQNFNNKRVVDTLTFNLNHLKGGKLEVYRPKGK